MRLPAPAARRTRRLASLLAVAASVAVVLAAASAGPVAAEATGTAAPTDPTLVAQEATTSSTTGMGQTTDSSAPTSFTTTQGAESGQTGIVEPSPDQVPLNPGWQTDQMDVQVWPEFDQKAVLVIAGLSLPADVPLPATLKFPIPTGAVIAGIGEISPTGSFSYNYADSYPPVESGSEWDIVTIEVQDYRQLQIDYYYDPGLPPEAGQRSFPLLVQTPMDVGMLILHVQQPARATDFEIQPPFQGEGQAEDGFTYSVTTYSDVKAGSTLGITVSYYKPDGSLSIDSGGSSGPTEFNTNTVLLAAILVIVVIVGALVVYRLFFGSPGGKRPSGRSGAGRSAAAAAAPVGTKKQRRKQAQQASKGGVSKSGASKGAAKGAASKGTTSKGAGTKAATQDATPEDTDRTEPEATQPEATEPQTTESEAAAGAEESGEAVEYCNACGEELTTDSPFCPSCGEARS